MTSAILTLNAGSASLKLAVFVAPQPPDLGVVIRGSIEHAGGAVRLLLRSAGGATIAEHRHAESDNAALLPLILGAVRQQIAPNRLTAVGHRVVHGGMRFENPVRADEAVLAELHALKPLAPLHQEHNTALIEALLRLEPDVPQVACFDTSFHWTMPDTAKRFALPRDLHDSGIRRFGAHGLSYEHVVDVLAERAPRLARGRTVVAHLGGGASLCALAGGKSIDTTMGLTPLDGLMMNTRSGAIDPGALLFLQQARGLSTADLETLLYRKSGVLGVSGLSGDLRDLLASAEPAAAEAVALYVARLAREVAAMACSLGGLEGLVFTGGVGEHMPAIRSMACERLRWLGVLLDGAANEAGAFRISAPGSRVEVLVVPTDEEIVIARHTRAVLNQELS